MSESEASKSASGEESEDESHFEYNFNSVEPYENDPEASDDGSSSDDSYEDEDRIPHNWLMFYSSKWWEETRSESREVVQTKNNNVQLSRCGYLARFSMDVWNNVYYCSFSVKKNIVVRKIKCLQFTVSPKFQLKT